MQDKYLFLSDIHSTVLLLVTEKFPLTLKQMN